MKKKLFAILMAAIMVFAFAACSSGDSGGGEASGGGEIAVLVPSADHGWTGAVLNYAEEYAADNTSDYTIKVYAATDAKEQAQQIDDMLASSTPPAGIVILPYDNTLESAMTKVAQSDIPFIMYDRIIDAEAVQEKVVANVKGDNEGIGIATADRFADKDGMVAGDKVYVMIGDTSSVPEMRNQGFKDELKTLGWTDDQIATLEFSKATGWSRSEGKQIFIDWLNGKTGDEIATYHYIFTHDDEIAMGILEALAGSDIDAAKKDAFLTNVVSIGTSSGLNEIYEVLKGEHANSAYPDIVQNFDLFSVTYDPGMVKTAIEDMVKHLGGEEIAKDHTISVDVVDSTNVTEYQGF
ncbi:MAG: substrate-binding domain-containing protein [Clostridiales Family XIII bacterium]|jgi:ribose transport system substrate-binding protein|nr:substrate-binding domain-containing protein [Clostridiales Family XIII bacterium]